MVSTTLIHSQRKKTDWLYMDPRAACLHCVRFHASRSWNRKEIVVVEFARISVRHVYTASNAVRFQKLEVQRKELSKFNVIMKNLQANLYSLVKDYVRTYFKSAGWRGCIFWSTYPRWTFGSFFISPFSVLNLEMNHCIFSNIRRVRFFTGAF